jgi:hypothetical protein
MNSIASRVSARHRGSSKTVVIPTSFDTQMAKTIRNVWGTPAASAKLRHASPETVRTVWSWLVRKN